MIKLYVASFAIICFTTIAHPAMVNAQTKPYYQESTWKPRAFLPYEDVIRDDFWPKSPPVNNSYNAEGFDKQRLSKVPPPGVHPRVLITPTDLEIIRAKVALGEKAPAPFKVMWERVTKSQSAFYALVTKNNKLGKILADELVAKLHSLEPKLDLMDKQPDRDNMWDVERSIIASGEPDPPTEIYDLLDYDYLSGWMDNADKELARKVIARLTYHRITNFLANPDHFMINNHEGFGMEYIRLMLLIEGEKGFNAELFNTSCKKVNSMLDWYLDDDGMCYESIKGWLNISVFSAVGLRKRNLLEHDHLQAKMRFFRAALRWEDGQWHIRDEMRASAFHVIWMMHYYHPKDEKIDLLYKSTFSTHDFLTDPNAKWPNPVGICQELLLLYADDGMIDNDGKPLDWNSQEKINSLNLPLTWQDNQRGYVDTRNSWRKDDLHVGFVCKQDFFYGGHEGSEDNRLTLWKDGVNWIQDNNMLATKATFLQNMITVDGKGCHWPPAPGTWLGVKETSEGLVAAGDGKDGFSYSKSMQIHPLAYPSLKLGYYAPFSEGNFDLSRDLQVAFNPRTVKWNDGYAHTDYGPWSGETRLVENYRTFNPMQKAYRTVQVAKGSNPYVLVIDDYKKDEQMHQFNWNISVPMDVELVDATTPEVVFQNTEPSANRENDLILGKNNMTRDPKTGKLKPKKGDPLCLIRVLWRNTDYGFPVPHIEKFEGYNQVVIPARAISPEYRVLIYPFKFGEELPKTTWNKNRTQLTVKFKNQTDSYNLKETDGGRTVIAMQRDDKVILASASKPSRPVFLVRGDRFDINDLRYTRDETKIPTYLIDGSEDIQMILPEAPVRIHYTLDGSEPTISSPVYNSAIKIGKTCDIKAKTFDPNWINGESLSETVTAHLTVRDEDVGIANLPISSKSGLLTRVYEKSTQLYNNKGFFDADRIMMPNLDLENPILTTTTMGFVLPQVTPTHAMIEQCKGFYRFSGMFYAKQEGVYKFDVNSCGPVTFDVGKQSVISAIGVFHQQQKHRQGEAVLGKGWHNIDLVICDPIFWNINSLEPMPVEVKFSVNGATMETITDSKLSLKPEVGIILTNHPAVLSNLALKNVPMLEPGFDMAMYDQSGKRRDRDFLDVDNLIPIKTNRSKSIEVTDSRNIVTSYSGYFFAPESGIYIFHTSTREGDNANLGSLQASCQNQIKIGNEYVVQRGVYGRNPNGKIELNKGWHPISLRFGVGNGDVSVTLPEGQTIALNGENIYRHTLVTISSEGKRANQSPFEIYGETKISLTLPEDAKTQIRYTLNGELPNSNSLLYSSPIFVNKSIILTAIAFKGNNQVTAPSKIHFKLVNMPQSGLLGNIDFDGWDGKTGKYNSKTNYQVWISPNAKITDGPYGKALNLPAINTNNNSIVDANVTRPSNKAGMKLYHIKMRENALTIAIWFKASDNTGKLFGKDGYNAFGKGYKTISCSINNGVLRASPGNLTGGKIDLNTWQYVVLTASEKQMDLYLNGQKVASGPGTKEISTDALDFFTQYNVNLAKLGVYDRALEADEINRLFNFEKPK